MAAVARVTFKGAEEIDALLAKIPALLLAKGGPSDKAVRAAGMVVSKRARKLAPVSKRTGTEKKQSKQSKADWPHEVRREIGVKVAKYPTTSLAVVGAKHPNGNAAHFMQEQPRRHVLWGKSTAVRRFRVQRNWITQAFDETGAEQQSAVVAVLKTEVDKIMKAG